MIDELRKGIPCCRTEICLGIEAHAVARLDGENSDRWC